MSIDIAERAELRRALLHHAPWLDASDVGPRSVDAGLCDRCTTLPRLLPTCGPEYVGALCAHCADTVGDDAWCDGHQQVGIEAREWSRTLPDTWAPTVMLWWLATGELRGVEPMTPDVRGNIAGLPPHLTRHLQ